MSNNQDPDSVAAAEAIARSILDIKEQELILDQEHLEAKKLLGIKVRELRKICPHPKWTYVPDASGNNDSYSYCNYCGVED